VLKETDSSSLETHEEMYGALDWALNIDKALCVETSGMSDVWDWVLKETQRTVSTSREKSWGASCRFGLGTPRVWENLGT
jgi:hypothetical protein